MLDERNRHSIINAEALSALDKRDAEEEARKVAEAIGYNRNQIDGPSDGGALSRVISGRSEMSGRSVRSSSFASYGSVDTDDPRSPAGNLLKSPELRDLESPRGSEYDDTDSEEEIVPEYVAIQEEALMKARERALKAEEEEREREMELLEKKNAKGSKKTKSTKVEYGGASGALDLLAELSASDKRKK